MTAGRALWAANRKRVQKAETGKRADRALLNMEAIYDFAETVDPDDVRGGYPEGRLH